MNTVNLDGSGQLVINLSGFRHVPAFVVIAACFYIPSWRFNPNVYIFENGVSARSSLERDVPPSQLKPQPKFLQPVKAVHNPIVFFDQSRGNIHFRQCE